jgi:acetyl esterase/lipase
LPRTLCPVRTVRRHILRVRPRLAALAAVVAAGAVGAAAWGGGEPQVVEQLDVYRPASDGPHPGIVLIHGGAFQHGERQNLAGTARYLAELGYDTFSISYRLIPDAPWWAPKADAFAAVRWLRAHASDLALDPDRLGALGYSAGGNLAALLATLGEGRERLRAAVSWSGPMDFQRIYALRQEARVYVGCRCRTRLQALSPVTYVDRRDAPLLLVNSTHEAMPLSQATEMAARLDAAGVPHRLLALPGTAHADAYARRALAPTLAFLRRYLGPPEPVASRATPRAD